MKILGPYVEGVGLTVALVASSFFLHAGYRAGVYVGIGVYLLDRFFPQAFNFLKNFAEPTTWPGYVGLGVAALFAAHHGGGPGVAVVAGLFATGDGRMFNSLY